MKVKAFDNTHHTYPLVPGLYLCSLLLLPERTVSLTLLPLLPPPHLPYILALALTVDWVPQHGRRHGRWPLENLDLDIS